MMTPLFQAAWEIHQFLTHRKIPYAIIGGLAVQRWGLPRLTVDVDLTVAAPLEKGSEKFVQSVLDHFQSRETDTDPFLRARRDRIVLVSASNGRGIDMSFGVPSYQDRLFERAIDFELERGKRIRLCSAEDLVVHKCVAGRPQDLRDVDGVIARQGPALDVDYVRHWLEFFDELLDEPVALKRFERAWQESQRTTARVRQARRGVKRK